MIVAKNMSLIPVSVVLTGTELQWFAVWTTDAIRDDYRAVNASKAGKFVVWGSDLQTAVKRARGGK